jgi:DNA-binding MarR family transcriptional regulator
MHFQRFAMVEPDRSPCQDPLVDRLFSIVGRLGVFRLLLEATERLTANQLRVLFHLHYRGPACMRQISEGLHVSQPAATGIIDRMVDAGLVDRGHNAPDRRRVQVSISEKGAEQIGQLRCAGAEAAHAVFVQLSAAQREALFAALEPAYELLFAGDGEPNPDESYRWPIVLMADHV